jgi:hypothetical protein
MDAGTVKELSDAAVAIVCFIVMGAVVIAAMRSL